MDLTDPYVKEKLSRWPNHKQWVAGITNDDRVFIQDDNFQYDARLYIDGDFPSLQRRLDYANAIAEILNEHSQ